MKSIIPIKERKELRALISQRKKIRVIIDKIEAKLLKSLMPFKSGDIVKYQGEYGIIRNIQNIFSDTDTKHLLHWISYFPIRGTKILKNYKTIPPSSDNEITLIKARCVENMQALRNGILSHDLTPLNAITTQTTVH